MTVCERFLYWFSSVDTKEMSASALFYYLFNHIKHWTIFMKGKDRILSQNSLLQQHLTIFAQLC